MSDPVQVTVEFYGIPRQRAGRAEQQVCARTVAEALAAVEQGVPALRGMLDSAGRPPAHYLLSLNGQRFVSCLDEPLRPGDHLLILSADIGG